MEKDWDNEIDSFLKASARREVAFAQTIDAHLDADEISAFAENALPKLARERYVAHLADCTNCRKILANLTMFQDAEDEEKTFAAAPSVVETNRNTIVSDPRISWFEKIKSLFAIPNLAYATAGLAILLIGTVAFIALRNSQNTSVASLNKEEVPQLFEKQSTESEPVAVANTVSNVAANMVATVVKPSAQNSNAVSANTAVNVSEQPQATPKPEADIIGRLDTRPTRGPSDNSTRDILPAPETKLREEQNESDRAAAPAAIAPPAPMVSADAKKDSERVKQEEDKVQKTEVAENKPPQNDGISSGSTSDSSSGGRGVIKTPLSEKPKGPMRNQTQNQSQNMPESSLARKKSKEESPTRSVGGKTFQNQNGVWTDSAYNGQAQKSVSRDSDDFNKLDSNLRSIANNLGGTVVIVWKGKAYKIF